MLGVTFFKNLGIIFIWEVV